MEIRRTRKSLDELLKEATDAWMEVVETPEYRRWSRLFRTWTEAKKTSDENN